MPPSITLPRYRDLGLPSESLLEPQVFAAGKTLLHTNLAEHDERLAGHLLRSVYAPRDCALADVSLFALPADARLVGGGHFLLQIGNSFPAEQYPPSLPKTAAQLAANLLLRHPTVDLESETVLIARFGVFTWGHWLCELLPKLVLVENAYPGRFSYALPDEVFAAPAAGLPFARMRESLAAYGIEEGRAIRLRGDRDYRFSRLFAVDSAWSDYMLHPGAARLMRTRLRTQAAAPAFRRLAVRRVPGWGRELQNFAELEGVLRGHSFAPRMMGVYPFAEQVAAFAEAEMIFAVLGSDLANLIYAPEGVGVITAAPPVFGDRFFHALLVERQGRMIDLRGPVTRADPKTAHRSDFAIAPHELENAIALLTRPAAPATASAAHST